MPPKKTKQQNIEAEEKLTAVLIADSFDQQLMPLTESTPRCLLPLCNVPLIEYTFELLATAGVEEILIFCCIHPQQIKDYVAGSKWSKSHSPFEVRVIVTQEAMSVGDVLRELDGKSLIRTDFILIYGDVVSNMNLAGALEQHKARKAVDKNTIMTMMVKEADPGHRARAQPDAVFVVDDANQQCVHYVGPKRGLASQSTVPLSVELFEKHPRLQIRYDLMDCQIDICSVEVPALFTENFDYQDLRRDFVTGILGSEVLDSTFYLHSIGREYAARVQNGQLYDAVSRDVIARWTFPMVPESNLQEGNEYIHKRNHVYQEPGIKLGRTCTLERNLVVGRGTRIGEHAHLADSTLGRGCVVGDHAHVTGAYLLDHVTVADHCRVERSILGRNVNVLSGCTVGTGCLLGDGVIVGPDAHLPPFTRLTRALDGETPDRALVGAEGNAVRWEPSDDEDEDETYAIQAGALAADLSRLNLGDNHASDCESDSSAESLVSGDEDEAGQALGDSFESEVAATIDRAFAEGHAVNDTLLELKGLRFANNKNNQDIRSIVIPRILEQVDLARIKTSLATVVVKRWGQLIDSLINSEADQANTLVTLRQFCVEEPGRLELFVPTIMQLYNLGIIVEDVISPWHQMQLAAKPTGSILVLHRKLQALVDWLNTADVEDSDDEDDESE